MSHNSQPDCELFNFASQLQFDARASLLRSRSDTFIRHDKTSHADRLLRDETSQVDHSSVPSIDFSLRRHQPKGSRLKPKRNGRAEIDKQQTKNEQFVRKPLPKVLEQPKDVGFPFVTSFRIHSAGTAKRLGVRDGMYHAGLYKPLDPHAFRGNDFRPDAVERLKEKPPFITVFATDCGNLELNRKSISVHNKCSAQNNSMNIRGGQESSCSSKSFVTSTKHYPKWDHALILPKENEWAFCTGVYRHEVKPSDSVPVQNGHEFCKLLLKRSDLRYERGISKDHIRMNEVMKQLSWCSKKEKIPTLDRPDIEDYKTTDWLQITRHPKEETTILR